MGVDFISSERRSSGYYMKNTIYCNSWPNLLIIMHILIKYLTVIIYTWIFVSSHIHADAPSSSLWGKKVKFLNRSCSWELSKTCMIPPLEELSVCVDLMRKISTSEWTAFDYKGPGGQHVELGLAGVGGNLKASLFGQEWIVPYDLPLNTWHTVCLTWSSHAKLFQMIVDGSNYTFHLNETFPRFLATNGTLTLGVSHRFVGGVIDFETGKNLLGDLYLFRMWEEHLSVRQLEARRCVDGNIVTWSEQDLQHQGCPPTPDPSLKCEWSKYQIKMNTSIKTSIYITENKIKEIVLTWLTNVFPQSISVHSVFISHLSYQTRDGLNQHNNEKIQGRGNWSNKKQWFDCLVFVRKIPEADVSETEAEIQKLLKPAYNYKNIILQTNPTSINVLSVAHFPNVTSDPALTTAVATKNPDIESTNITTSVTQTSLQTREMEQTRSSTIFKPDRDFGDTFFRVYLNLTMSGNVTSPKNTLQQWLQQTLGDQGMEPLNLVLAGFPKYISSFQIQSPGKVDVTQTQKLIYDLLKNGFSNDSFTINVTNNEVNVLHIDPGLCHEETMQTVYGIYIWPEMMAQSTYSIGCVEGEESASRFCKLNGATDKAVWDPPDMSMCMTAVSDFDDLGNIEVTANNSADIVNVIENLLKDENSLTDAQLHIVIDKLFAVTEIATLTTELASSITNILSNICEYTTNISKVTNEILYITDLMGDRTVFTGSDHNMTAPSLALQLINPDTSQFHGLTFGVSSFQTGLTPEIYFNSVFSEKSDTADVASISLPSTVENFFPNNEARPRVQFHFYGKENLFQENDTQSNIKLNSYVVSASVTNATVSDLEIPVVITFQHLQQKEDQAIVKCVYWDFNKNNGKGGWNDKGCEMKRSNATHTLCYCDHLTHFGVLLDISKTPINPKDEKILTVISYLGSGISSIFLGVTLLTYVAFEKLRRDNPSKILINLSVALLGLNMLFLVNSWFASFDSDGLCIAVAAILHYFLLAAFTWMGLEAINMYLALVKVFNVYVPSYILKFCALGWGSPLIVVSLVLAIDTDSYGNSVTRTPLEKSSPFCWIKNDMTFYTTVVSFVILILICNIGVFAVVLEQIRKMRVNKPTGSRKGLLHDLRVVTSLTFLLGLTWLPAFFAWGPAKTPLLYLFSILNSLQGFFIFLFYCLMKDNVRKQWRIHLCCGRFRLTEYTDWSRSVTLGAKAKGGLQVSPSIKSETTSDRKISDCSNSVSSHDQVRLTQK